MSMGVLMCCFRIIQRDIPKELDLVADQAQTLKALLWDYDDLSQVRSQL